MQVAAHMAKDVAQQSRMYTSGLCQTSTARAPCSSVPELVAAPSLLLLPIATSASQTAQLALPMTAGAGASESTWWNAEALQAVCPSGEYGACERALRTVQAEAMKAMNWANAGIKMSLQGHKLALHSLIGLGRTDDKYNALPLKGDVCPTQRQQL